jgi:hypothetical protein
MLPARLREAGYVPGANRVSMHGEHDWDSSCRLLSGLRFGRTDRKYDIDFQADDLTCELAKNVRTIARGGGRADCASHACLGGAFATSIRS